MAKLSPSRSSTVVLARRVWRPGTRMPLTVTEALASIELTSGATSMLITPSASTVGVKARLTPNSLNSTEIASPPSPPWATGIGNSPPARKLAVSPDSATSVGSARVVTTPLRSSAFNVALISRPAIEKKRAKIPNASVIEPSRSTPSLVSPSPSESPTSGVNVEPLPMTPWKPLSPPPDTKALMPRSLNAPRRTSEKRTSSMTCWAEPIDIRLMTLPGA